MRFDTVPILWSKRPSHAHVERGLLAAELRIYASRGGARCDQAESLVRIQERYEVADQAWRITLARLLGDDAGRATVARLREDGWLDWQTLMAAMNVGPN